jgi:hypothetical protein
VLCGRVWTPIAAVVARLGGKKEMVESYANSVEDKLIEGLTFKLEGGASYINDRRFCTFHPQGSNYYSPSSGAKLIKIALTGKDWMDPSTFRVAFDVVNEGTYVAPVAADAANGVTAVLEVDQRLRPLSGPWCMFRRVRLLAAGQVVEDIGYYSRVHEMMDVLTSTHSRINESVEGFGRLWDEHSPPTNATYLGIRGNDRQTVFFKPLLGLLNQTKFLPLQYIQSLSLELELVDNAADSVVANTGGVFTAANNSLLWHLENVQVKCDMISLDNGVQESYHNVLMSSKDIPIHYNTFTSQFQTILAQDEAFVNVSRAATRLKSVFISLDKTFAGTRITPGRKWWNDLLSPASDNNRATTIFKHSNADEFELAVQIGSKTFPDGNPIRSHAESYYNLRKTLGVQSSSVHSFDIKPQEYHDHRLIMAIDTEKSLGASFTGINTRSGELLTVKFKYKNATTERKADRIHIILHTDNIMKINATGVEIYD